MQVEQHVRTLVSRWRCTRAVCVHSRGASQLWPMAHSIKDALLAAGVVAREETQEARQEAAWQEGRAREAAQATGRLDEPAPTARWEAAPTGHIVDQAP